jgi:hypothetical protein
MHRASDSSSPANGSSASPQSSSPLDGGLDGHVCPFCGLTRELSDDLDASAPCPRCTLADTPTTRNATKARIGPWHVRQMRNPWAPGMRWETLLALIKRGQVTKDSVVRGPTTHQLWKRASEVKGLSREFGVCYSCGGEIDAQANLCSHCNRLQEPPANPNVLIETRDAPNQNGGDASAAKPAPSGAGLSPARPNGNPSRRRGADDDIEQTPHMDIGAATPSSSVDPDDMLSVDDPQRVAELARSVTSRPPQQQRSNRPPPTPAAQAQSPAPAPAQQQKKKQPPPPQQDAASRPVPLRPRQPGADDALLTPQELAAAFQLDFTPATGGSSGKTSARNGGGGGGMPRRKRSKFFVAFVLVVLIGLGVAALMYLRPDLREQATTWSQTTYASVKEAIKARTAPAGARKPTLTPTPTPAPVSASPATRPSKLPREGMLAKSPMPTPAPVLSQAPPTPAISPSPATHPAITPPRPEPTIAIAPAPPPRTKTVVVEPSAAQSRETTKALDASETPVVASAKSGSAPAHAAAPAPVEIIRIDPPATASASSDGAKPRAAASTQPQPQQKVWTNLSEAEDEARRLWRLAFDAEQNQDFVEAVSLYEQIKKLPPSVHPAGLEVRLSLAKKLTK